MNRRTGRRVVTVLAVAAVAVIGLRLSRAPDVAPGDASLRVASLLGDADAPGLRRADPGYEPRFPQDHGPHPDYRAEWWYFTGNLDAPGGREFGFQFTIFRFALGGPAPERPSRWATRQAWMGHLAVTDVSGARFFRAERMARGGPMGLAGGSADPFRVWIDDWWVASPDAGFLPLDIRAVTEDFGLSLRLEPGPGPVLQGDHGYSRKGPGQGNASYYYSYPRLPVSGELRLEGESVPVTGEAWLDREWGTSALGPDVRGWDWFALRLDDGSELMYYRLRRADGSADRLSAGMLTGRDGGRLEAADLTVVPRRYWKSPETGDRYPVAWEISVPSRRLQLEVDALLDDQEMALSVNYWEGAVRISGTRAGTPIGGRGYLEMTGYQ